MPILVDYNQTALSCVFVAQKENGSDIDESMIRHMILGSLLNIKHKFGAEYGQLVLCCDGPKPWRGEVFPYYKFKRKESKADSPLDWDKIHGILHTIQKELDESFPYKVIKLPRCEGDDVIAVIAAYYQENDLIQVGLEEEPQKTLIISSDKDFKQLQVYKNLRQYSMVQDRYLDEPDPKAYRAEMILRGDSGDGVPSVLSADDCFVLGIRQKPLTAKRLEPLMEAMNGLVPVPDEYARNIDRNTKLIDLLYSIPEDIKSSILDAYANAHVEPRSSLMSYFIKHKLANLSKDIQHF